MKQESHQFSDERFKSIENELESYTKDLLNSVIDHKAEKSEFYRKVK